jgi:MFS family permease
MDTIGAVIGPAFALLFLYAYPGAYKMLFFLAFIPGLTAIATSFLLKEKPADSLPAKRAGFFSFLSYWKNSKPEYRKLVIGLLLFALVNSSDVFLLLKAKEAGLSDIMVIGIYIFYNLIYALMAFPMGILADNKGIRNVFISGLLFFFSCIYRNGHQHRSLYVFCIIFLYGVYASATEGISKAWITQYILQNGNGYCNRNVYGVPKHLYTCIQYNDGADLVQLWIYYSAFVNGYS